MKEYFFDTIIKDLEQICYIFREKTLSKDQFKKVEELMYDIASMENKNSVCTFDDIAAMCAECAVCSQKKEGALITDTIITSPVLIPMIRNVIPKTIWEDMSNQENYNNAMKVVD